MPKGKGFFGIFGRVSAKPIRGNFKSKKGGLAI